MLFSKFKGDLYAVQTGEYVGRFLVPLEEKDESIVALMLPDMENLSIDKKEFDYGKDAGIIEFVERLPKNILKVIRAKFEENKQLG